MGSGKSTALRWASSRLHPPPSIRSSGSPPHRAPSWNSTGKSASSSKWDTANFSRAVLTKLIKKQVLEIAQDRKKRPVLITNEASLLRFQILAELHTITQFQGNSKSIRPIILAGQNNLADLLIYRTSLTLVFRILARSHLTGVSFQNMQAYLLHHLKIADVRQNLFSDPAVTATQQGSGGFFRKANHLARGAIIAAAEE
ncbi:hypothetical protein DFAR_1860039 [Desulfarculales bacterium]